MKWTILVSLLALLVPAFAQNDTDSEPSAYVQDVLAALEGAGLTTLASALTVLSTTPAGEAFFEELEDGDKTIFAPSNEAFASAGFVEDLSTVEDLDIDFLTNTLLYHIIDEDITDDEIAVSPNTTVFDTLLVGSTSGGGNETDDEGEINFPADSSVPIVLTRESEEDNSTFTVFNSEPPVEISGEPTEVANLQIYIIDAIISLPQPLADVAGQAGLTQLASLLGEQDLLEVLNSSTTGLTIFAPNDAAFEALSAELGELDDEAVALVLQNHVINGTVAFSSDIADEEDGDDDDDELLPLAGPAFTFTVNETGTFVTSGEATAQIVETDFLFNGGVIHVIDTVLVNEQPEVNPPPTNTGGGSPTQTGGGGGSETSTPAEDDEDSPNPAGKLQVSWGTFGLGGVVVGFGAMMGGGLVAV